MTPAMVPVVPEPHRARRTVTPAERQALSAAAAVIASARPYCPESRLQSAALDILNALAEGDTAAAAERAAKLHAG